MDEKLRDKLIEARRNYTDPEVRHIIIHEINKAYAYSERSMSFPLINMTPTGPSGDDMLLERD